MKGKEHTNRLKKMMAGMLTAVLLAVSALPLGVSAADQDLTITSKDNKVLTYQAGKSKKWILTVTNHTSKDMESVVVGPQLGDTNEDWPFKTEVQDYQQEIGTLQAGKSADVTFELTQREDVPTKRYTVQFTASAVTEEGSIETTQKFYVNTTAKPEEKKEDKKEDSKEDKKEQSKTEENSSDAADAMLADAGGYSNEAASFSGGGSVGDGSVPRVIVTGFSTDPAEVKAGSDFKLTIHLKNTSKTTRVKNMLFDLTAPTEGSDEQTMAPAFLPSSGSSTIYLDGIASNGTADISIKLSAKSDLLQKPYSIDLSMIYEDANASQIEASSSLSIPVKQEARFEFSDFEINPESIEVGEEANVMCSLYNLGRVKLYNVKAIFEGSCIKKEEVFLGNVDSGATAQIDAMLEGEQETEGPAAIKMTLSYEDESGNVSTAEKELQIEVTAPIEEDMDAYVMEEEPQSRFPVIPVIVILAIIAVIAGVVIWKKKKQKKQLQIEEEELQDELERSSEDEH